MCPPRLWRARCDPGCGAGEYCVECRALFVGDVPAPINNEKLESASKRRKHLCTSSLAEISRISDGRAASVATGSDNIAVNWGHKDQCIRVSARPNSSGWGA